eukprot:10285574-Prorocentrum_lima.AAC.1
MRPDTPTLVADSSAPFPDTMVDVAPDPTVALQQQLQACHNSLHTALQHTVAQAQAHINTLVQQALQPALADLPSQLAA